MRSRRQRMLREELERVERRLEASERVLGEQARVLAKLESGVDALVRKSFLTDLAAPGDLGVLAERFQLSSQGEEDGIVVALLRRVGLESRRAIEIGCGPNGGNAGVLARELDWPTLMVDAGPRIIAEARRAYAGTAAVLVEERVTAENLNPLLERHSFAGPVDYVGIDVDGNDYWLWHALAAEPRVLGIEFNPAFGAELAVTIPYDPAFDWSAREHPRPYFGASLPALERLGGKRGYRLVAVDPTGANAFFVRADLAREALPTRSAGDLWREPRKGGMREPLRAEQGIRAWFAERECALVEV